MIHRELVLDYMKKHGSITQLEATYDLGITRLSAVIYDLKNEDGIDIISESETSKNRYGKNTTYARYKIAPKQGEYVASLI